MLIGEISKIKFGTFKDAFLHLFVGVTIKNVGSPSIFNGWPLQITVNNLVESCQAQYLPQNITSVVIGRIGDSPATIDRSHFIYDKEITPIQTGGMARGWIWYTLKKLTADDFKNGGSAQLKILFKDINATEYSAEREIAQQDQTKPEEYIPGLHLSFDEKCVITKRPSPTPDKGEPPPEPTSSVYP
jgi:hypothetical protein